MLVQHIGEILEFMMRGRARRQALGPSTSLGQTLNAAEGASTLMFLNLHVRLDMGGAER